MREKRRYNGALRILTVFQGRASQPASQGGGGFQSLPAAQPRLGAAPKPAPPARTTHVPTKEVVNEYVKVVGVENVALKVDAQAQPHMTQSRPIGSNHGSNILQCHERVGWAGCVCSENF